MPLRFEVCDMRPPLADELRRTQRGLFRANEQEYETLVRAAEAAGLPLARYIREAALAHAARLLGEVSRG